MSHVKPWILLLGVAVALFAATDAVAKTSGTIVGGYTKFSVASAWRGTYSQQWSRIPRMEMRFSTDMEYDAVLQFCTEVVTDPGETLLLRAKIDGHYLHPDGDGGHEPVAFATDMVQMGSRCFIWAMRDLPAGQHKARVQWSSQDGGWVSVAFRSMLLQLGE